MRKIMKLFQTTKAQSELTRYDREMLPIAYVKFRNGQGRAMRPVEFYQTLADRVQDIRIAQAFVFARGSGAAGDGGCSYTCEYVRLDRMKPATYKTKKEKISAELMANANTAEIRSFNLSLNKRIEETASTIVHFIEYTTKTHLRFAQLKFMEDMSGELFFIGLGHELFYLPKDNEEEQMNVSGHFT